MRDYSIRKYLYLALGALVLFSLPLSVAKRARTWTSSLLGPVWKLTSYQLLANTHSKEAGKGKNLRQPLTWREKAEALELQNSRLQEETKRLLELLDLEQEIADNCTQPAANTPKSPILREALQRRQRERKHLLSLTLDALPARVIYRSPSLWYGSLWIDVGEDDNHTLGRIVVAKDSPVVVGQSLIGVIDVVNAKQSRVRLISDANLCPAVRAVRGDPQRQLLARRIDLVASQLAQEDSLFQTREERHQTLETLLDIREQLIDEEHTWCLSKGELRGSGSALWRKQGTVLRGVGFNYDFADEEGPARDLLTGTPETESREWPIQSLVQAGDILVTTGLDGIFPPGLQVAEVTTVAALREGDYFYELEARPIAEDLDSISLVSVLPALPFKP